MTTIKNGVLLFVVLIAAFGPVRAFAQSAGSSAVTKSMIAPRPPVDSTIGLLGQQQNYSVQLRGNGEAVVAAHITFSNTNAFPMKTVTFRIPRVVPTDLIVFQVLREPRCLEQVLGSEAMPTCLRFETPDYYQYWYGGAKYEKATFDLRTDTITITLPRVITANSSGAIILYYRAMGYTKRNLFGTFAYTFETLKTEDRIQSLQVGVAVDDELILAGTKGQTQYRFPVETKMMLEAPSVAGGVADSRIDSYVQQIGQGTITKTAHNLQPLDSYTVKGTYADHIIKLYAKQIAVGILIIVLVFAAIVLIGKKFMSSPRLLTSKNSHSIEPFFLSLSIGFFAALFIVLYTLLLFFSRGILESVSYEFSSMISILFAVISVGVYGLLLLVPPLLMGLKRGMVWGLSTFGCTILMLAIDSVIVLFVLTLMNRTPSYPIPMPYPAMMEKGSISPSTEAQPPVSY